MKALPLYDDSADLVCSISAAEIPERIELIERIRTAMTTLERTENGLILHFAPQAETEADIRRFAVDEKRCCQFWGFAVVSTPKALSLRWDGPPAANNLITRLAAFLQGTEPASTLAGLL